VVSSDERADGLIGVGQAFPTVDRLDVVSSLTDDMGCADIGSLGSETPPQWSLVAQEGDWQVGGNP